MYVDPGSGSMMLQVLLASMLGSLLMFRQKVRDLWLRLLHRNKTKG